jgi:hypothetical protein
VSPGGSGHPGGRPANVGALEDGRPRTVAATSDQARDVDQVQYDADGGPAAESAWTSKVLRVAVTDAAVRWPEFAESARAASVGSYLSAPLFLDEKVSGSLNH